MNENNQVSTDVRILFKTLLPQEQRNFLANELRFHLLKVLSLKSPSEKNYIESLGILKDEYRNYTIDEIKEMWSLYATCKLSVEPIEAYWSVPTASKVRNAYDNYLKANRANTFNKVNQDEFKALQDKTEALHYFEFVSGGGDLPIDAYWLYDYLIEVVKIVDEQTDVKKMYWSEVVSDKKIVEDERIAECKRRIVNQIFLDVHNNKLHLSNLFKAKGL